MHSNDMGNCERGYYDKLHTYPSKCRADKAPLPPPKTASSWSSLRTFLGWGTCRYSAHRGKHRHTQKTHSHVDAPRHKRTGTWTHTHTRAHVDRHMHIRMNRCIHEYELRVHHPVYLSCRLLRARAALPTHNHNQRHMHSYMHTVQLLTWRFMLQ